MPFRRFRGSRGLRLRPVNRIKHVVDVQNAVVAGSSASENLVVAVDAPVLANTKEVQTGCTVNGIFLKLEAVSNGATGVLANFYMYVIKNPGNNLSLPDANVVGANDNKRFVIHQEMIMFQQVEDSNPRTVFVGVIVIPRGYKRFGPADRLVLRLTSPGVGVNYCFQCHYKEFR